MNSKEGQMAQKITKEMLDTVAGLSSADAAKKLGVSKTGITEARDRFRMKRLSAKPGPKPSGKTGTSVKGSKSSSIEEGADGSLIIVTTDEVPQSKDNIDDRMKSRGFDPEKYAFTYGFSEWEAQTPDGIKTLYSARATAVERKPVGRDALTSEDISAVIDGYVPLRGESADIQPSGTFVFNFADPQIGKTDINGGTHETVARFYASLDHACAILDEHPAAEIIWADLGDGIENFCNTSSQRQTNDLNLVEQVRVLRRLQVDGLLRLLEYAPVVHISVPSNHSQNRVGMQQAASTSHDDWGLEVQKQIEEVFQGRELPNQLSFLSPAPHEESVAYTTLDGTVLGFVHGHRSNSQNGLEAWWAGQALGKQPTAAADILFVGHFHNWSVRSVGKFRLIITTPALDNGSSWFTQSRGNVATAGVLTCRVKDRTITDQRIA